ncbi:MAG: ribosome silencing factor [Elusimicrobia bacterium]|nr:ribosome silencing factor [Elusimicrobiota bacterium]
MNFLSASRKAATIAEDKKAEDIVVLNIRQLTEVADYLLVFTVNSAAQMNAVLDTIEKEFKSSLALMPLHRDGRQSRSWAVLDYGGLVIHAMFPTARDLYALEKIWSGARTTRFPAVRK